jgi:hypothetical protein
MDISFRGDVWYWRGPAPFHFVTVPADESELIAELAPAVSYGWGMIPVTVHIGRTGMTISLWPKDDGYIVPLRRPCATARVWNWATTSTSSFPSRCEQRIASRFAARAVPKMPLSAAPQWAYI